MTINEMMAELRKLQRAGKGDQTVYIRRHGDTHCMPSVTINQYSHHVVIAAANPAILWPNNEQEAVCSNDDAMKE